MKVADILRSLVDLIDAAEQEESAQPQQPVVVNVNTNGASSNQGEEVETPLDEPGTMVPPLQAKLEIMKKMAGIPASHDDVVAVAADEDEPFEG